MFRSPVSSSAETEGASDQRVFYVFDNPECRFRGNAYQLEDIPSPGAPTILEPGISFFDRPDQQHLFKLHLPYVWRTPKDVDTLFLPLLNRPNNGVTIQSGLVETDWYPSPVNLIIAKPIGAAHFRAGDPVAQAILIPRNLRQLTLKVAPSHAVITRETRKGVAEWDKQHSSDRAAYKTLARDQRSRVES